jgi:hypothetical protein
MYHDRSLASVPVAADCTAQLERPKPYLAGISGERVLLSGISRCTQVLSFGSPTDPS